MRIAIVGFNDFELLERTMEKLMSEKQYFLFTVLVSNKESIGYKWAEKYGAPVEIIKADMDYLIWAVDYLVAYYDGSVPMHKLIFKFMQTGKHGTIIEGEKYT